MTSFWIFLATEQAKAGVLAIAPLEAADISPSSMAPVQPVSLSPGPRSGEP